MNLIRTSVRNTLLILALFAGSQAFAQQLLTGTIFDENNIPIPSARVYVKNQSELRVQANLNGVYQMRLMPGEYYLVYSATGYEDRESYVVITDKTVTKDIQLFPVSYLEMQDVDVTTKKTNPGREIMLKVVAKREQINLWNYAHTTDVDIKAFERIEQEETAKSREREAKAKEKKEKEEQKKKEKEKQGNGTSKEIEDPFDEQRNKIMEEANSVNLVEIKIQRNYAPNNKVKEFRTAYSKRGSDRELYYLTTVKSNFNFFENLLHLDDLHQSPVSSPISTPGILSYKYRLEAQYEENGQKIHKIKIIPRSTSTTTLTGYIYVIDSLWLVQKLELSMEKGNLLKYDYFNIYQEFEHPGDSICVLSKQVLSYGAKTLNHQVSTCKTEAVFSNYNFKPQFAAKFFNNELAVTELEAYEKDSVFWNQNRVISLTDEEKRFILIKDSIHERLNRKEYLDSIDSIFNKVTPIKVLWFGIDHRNRAKMIQWTINSVAAISRPVYVTGPRVAPGFSYFKKWKNQRYIDLYNELSYGFVDKTLFGNSWFSYRYNPFKFATIRANFSNDIDVIRNYDAISQIFNASNFIGVTSLGLNHNFEIVNGLFLESEFNFTERRSLGQFEYFGFYDSTEINSYFSEFKTYQALIGKFTLSFTPKQKFMREPYRKVNLGSKWPTFYVYYEKGVPKLFGSEVDHDYILAGFYQSFQIGTIGTTNYHIKSGKFLNSKQLYDADFKFHRRSDPYWFSNPLYSFQQLGVSLPSKDIFYEGHIIHHDNSAIINKIPFMKKLNVGLVFGGGALYVYELNWFHSEILGGLERNFKFSKRRLRVGIYGVLSDGNHIKPTSTFKVSFAVLDDRNMKWNF